MRPPGAPPPGPRPAGYAPGRPIGPPPAWPADRPLNTDADGTPLTRRDPFLPDEEDVTPQEGAQRSAERSAEAGAANEPAAGDPPDGPAGADDVPAIKPAVAYSAVAPETTDDDGETTVRTPNATPPRRPGATAAKARPTAGRSAGARPNGDRSRIHPLSIWALVLALFPLTFFIGMGLGYKARADIRRNNRYGEPFAAAAIWIGWAYIAVFLIGLLVYFWLRTWA